MKYKYVLGILMIMLLLSCNTNDSTEENLDSKESQEVLIDTDHQLSDQPTIDTMTEEEVTDTIWNLKEVQERNDYVIKESSGERKLTVMLYMKPEETEKGYYWVKVAEDNGGNFVTHFDFYVNPVDKEITYFDIVNDIEIDLASWREQIN